MYTRWRVCERGPNEQGPDQEQQPLFEHLQQQFRVEPVSCGLGCSPWDHTGVTQSSHLAHQGRTPPPVATVLSLETGVKNRRSSDSFPSLTTKVSCQNSGDSNAAAPICEEVPSFREDLGVPAVLGEWLTN